MKTIKVEDGVYDKLIRAKARYWRKKGRRINISDLIEVKKID